MKTLDKKKELSKCCNAPIEKLNDWGAEYMGCSKCFSAQSLDKKKTKELDWDTLGIKEIFSQWLFFNGKLTGKEAEELWNKLSLIFKATLTQQRTELLEEIKKEKEKHTPNSGAGRVLKQLLVKLEK